MENIIKSFAINLDEIKAGDEKREGTFTGYANVTEFRDSGGDIIHSGAFGRSLKSRSTVPLLALHDVGRTIGAVTLEEDTRGLKVVKGELNLEKEAAREVYSDMLFYRERKLPMEMSIGFRLVPKKWQWDAETDTRHIHEVNLKEVSIVPPGFAMNSRSTIRDVKADISPEFAALKKRLDELEQVVNPGAALEKLREDVNMLMERLGSLADCQQPESKTSADPPDRHSADDLPKVQTDDSRKHSSDPSLEDSAAILAERLRIKLGEILGDLKS